MSRSRCFALFFLALSWRSLSPAYADKTVTLESEALRASRWRSLGPATMGGRISDIAVDPQNSYTYYIGLATGGIMKTANNGGTWDAVFEHESVASIGALAIAPSDSKIVWAGTGEPNGRNSSAWGDGIYKSIDSGRTWKNMGLKDTQSIGRVIIDPKDPDTVYVAAVGHLWGPNKERGVYKTTDGGKTWQASLTVNADTGAVDLAMGDKGILFAAMYQRRRMPWGFSGVNPGSALYKSADSGKTWKKLASGLPAKNIGRIGIAVSPDKPNIVYAVIESPAGGSGGIDDTNSKYGGVFRSDDSGETWKRQSGTAPRGFYFGQIRVEPTHPDRVYVLGFEVSVSDDGGKTFRADGSRGVHSDMHAMWIDPARPNRLLLGGDGGLFTTYDRARTWEHINNFAGGEFYEVSVDNRQPYWCYGGLQDNGSWGGPSALKSYGGPTNADWLNLNGGDGFYVLTDPYDPDIVYAESQGGGLSRIDRALGRRASFNPATPEGAQSYRFNWNTPVFVSHYDRDAVYIGGNQLFKWTKKGTEWETVSPDLSKKHGERITAGGSGAETYGTIVTLSESPRQRGIVWAGTDDGNIQVTTDSCETWTDATKNLPEKVQDYYVNRVEASHFVAARAYAAIDGHRHDDMKTYLFVTENYGKSWQSCANDLPKDSPVKAIREDPINPNVLFAGTEFGAFYTYDRGQHWRRMDQGLPTVSVNDFAIQPRDHALVAATHGRSLYVLDNITPLEEMTADVQKEEIHLFAIAPAAEYIPSYEGRGGAREFQAEGKSAEAEIVYWQKSLVDEAPKITVTDAKGKTMATFAGERFPGLRTVRWDLRQPAEGGFGGRGGFFNGERVLFVKPGEYTVTLTLGKEKRTQKILVTGPPSLSEEPTETDHSREEDKAGKEQSPGKTEEKR